MLYFLLLALILSEIQAQDTNCVSLSTSEACPAYSQFYVDLGGLADNYPFLVNVTSVAQFDQRMRNYVNSTSFYLFPLGCLSSNYNPKVAYARYSLARLCADMVQNSHSLGPCNFENDIYPPPLCQNTCLEWVDDVDRITSDPNICSNTSLRNKTLNYYSEQCTSWQGVNGTIDQNCISGLANEPFYCGKLILPISIC
jgi:hypothetical protein